MDENKNGLGRIRELIKDLYETRLVKKEVADNEEKIKQELEGLISDQKVVNVTDFILIKNYKKRESISKAKFIEVYGSQELNKITETVSYHTFEVKKLG